MSSAGQPTTRLDGPRNKWEYKVVHSTIDLRMFSGPKIQPETFQEVLTTAGFEGWELVNTLNVTSDGYTQGVIFFFKRPAR